MQVSPLHLPLLGCSFLLAWLTWLTWRRRATPGGRAYCLLLCSVLCWVVANIGEKSVAGLAPKVFFADLQYIFAAITAAAWYVFACRYSGRDRLAPGWLLWALAVGPLSVAALTWSDSWLHLMRQSVVLQPSIVGDWGPTETLAIVYGPAFWIHACYAYALTVFGGAVLLEFGVRAAPQYREQVILLVVSMAIPLGLNMAYVSGFRPIGNFDLTPFGFTLATAVGAWTLVRDRALDLVPIARDFVLETMPDCVFVLDLRNRVIDVNRAAEELLGRSVRMIAGLPLGEVCPPAAARLFSAESSGVERMEFEWSVGEERRPYGMRVASLFHAHRSIGTLVVLTDMTQRRKAEEERRQFLAAVQNTQKLESLGVLAGGIAHDFNNLLVAILGNASLALEELDPDSAPYSLIKRIETSAEHAAELTQQLQMYSGRRTSAMRPVLLRDLLHEISDLLRWTVSKKVELSTQVDDELPWVQGDPVQLRQVIVNLISNASDSIGRESGHVRVSIRGEQCGADKMSSAYYNGGLSPGEHVVVEVSDDGCGMDPSTIRRIFEPFFTTKSEGRGLGLAAVLGIVRGHRAGIFVHSEVGIGTTFRVHFSVTESPVARNDEPTEKMPDLVGEGMVLFADDEQSVRAMAEQTFVQFGFRHKLACDGEEALRMFSEHADSIDVVVLDLSMPRMGGEEVIIPIRQRKPGVPVLISSGYSKEEVMSRFAETQPDAFLRKPYRPAELVARIREVLIGATSPAAADCDIARPSVQ